MEKGRGEKKCEKGGGGEIGGKRRLDYVSR